MQPRTNWASASPHTNLLQISLGQLQHPGQRHHTAMQATSGEGTMAEFRLPVALEQPEVLLQTKLSQPPAHTSHQRTTRICNTPVFTESSWAPNLRWPQSRDTKALVTVPWCPSASAHS